MTPDWTPIADHAVIGDGRSAALISRGGSIDWLCLPAFDGDAVFARILDRERGGRFSVAPTAPHTTEWRYLPDTVVLETDHVTAGGRIRVTDFMPVASEADKRRELRPEHEVLRRIACVDGEVEVEVRFDPRPGFGRRDFDVRDRGPLGWVCQKGREVYVFRGEIPATDAGSRPGVGGRETLRAGDVRWVGFTYTDEDPAVLPVFGAVAERRLAQTVAWWSAWAGRCRYEGPYRDAVVRSALTIKLLAYAPSGAVVAAPTTSLPERIGGVRNWDYRYCWLRDASLTIQSLMDLAYEEEAQAYLAWMLHSTSTSWPSLDVMYDLHGRRVPAERELEWLEGYRSSGPVRIGNAARKQVQLDIYGEVADAVHGYVQRGGRLDRPTLRLLVGLGRSVCDRWREPDEGIWEVRTEPRHHTYSKVMCWVALDRLLKILDEREVDVPTAEFRANRDAIRELVEARGWNEALGAYTSTLDGDDVDASLLLLGRYGYAPPGGERMRGTCAVIHRRLGKNGLLYRYVHQDDGLPEGEGAFGIASFWAVDCLCRQGQVEEAAARFERLLGYASDLGLYAEEIDPGTGEHLGNFPQAFTHIGLIDAALSLAAATGEGVGHGSGHAGGLERVDTA